MGRSQQDKVAWIHDGMVAICVKFNSCLHILPLCFIPYHISKLTKPRVALGRFARGVLAREDPVESFMKQVPQNAERLEVIYPVRA